MKKKIICFIPIKKKSERLKKKNFRILNKKPLYKHTIDKVIKIKDFDKIIVDTDSKEIQKYCVNRKISFIHRNKRLLKPKSNGNDLLKYWISIEPNYDLYFQIHVTSPFVSLNSIKKSVKILKAKNKFNSVFTATKEFSWYWFDKKPINFNKNILKRSQDLEPVIRDTTFLYGISKKEFLRKNSRIGSNPYIILLDRKESIDINDILDFKVAQNIK